ncbi:MAG: DUF1570 domain-containing protein [Planctomycetaceae bacterium]
MKRTFAPVMLCAFLAAAVSATADEFTFKDAQGETQTLHARLAGSGEGLFALELEDGRWELVEESAIVSRKPSDDPVPITADQMAKRLEEKFTAPLFEYRVAAPYVVGVVLTAPMDEETRPRVDRFLDKATTFMQSIDRMFTRFAEARELPLQPPRFPLVMLIFETDADFNTYTALVTGGRGPSTQNILGFYSAVSNWLAIRLDECDSFAVPLHEAIHQQVFNRGILQRLAPLPVWFNEGIATGFENDGGKISVDPTRVSRQYGGNARQKFKLRFEEIIEQDDAFRGDVLAGEAYTLAWCLHWLVVMAKPQEYTQYVRKLGSIEPLSDPSRRDRLAEFQETFGLDPKSLEQTIGQELTAAARRERVKLVPPSVPVGKLITQDQMGRLEIGLVQRGDKGGLVQGTGKIKNLSPFRTLTFHVTAAQSGRGIAWLAERVSPGRSADLERQLMPPSGGRGYAISIRSAIPGSEAEKTLMALPR